MLGSENVAAKVLAHACILWKGQRVGEKGQVGIECLLRDNKQDKNLHGWCHSGRHYILCYIKEEAGVQRGSVNPPKVSILVFCREVVCQGVFR